MQDENENYLDKVNLESPLFNALDVKKERKKLIIYLVGLNVVLIGFITLILLILFKDDKDDKNDKEEHDDVENTFKILKYDKDFIKPNVKLNLEFELVKVQNGMKGLIIRDPFTSILFSQLQVEYGQLIDTVGGLAHLDEHMIFGGSEKYEYYSMNRKIGETSGFISNALTGQTYQIYYISCKNKYKYEEAIDIILDSFRYPSYDEKIIEKEVLTINSEFYLRYRDLTIIFQNIIRQLSSNKTSFNGFGIGNNKTLRPNESLAISKKLKSYHAVVNRPENLFFIFYSNLTMNEAEKYIENNFNYSMHKFSDDEIDKEEKIKLETNIKNLKKYEIFDENLYEHGFYYNSDYNLNLLDILFHLGNIDYKDLQFDIIEYYEFLFNSKSLLKILKENNYIAINEKIDVYTELLIESNNILLLEIILTEKGLKELDKVLLIIYKYIDIMKKEGHKKEFFQSFIKYKNNQNIKTFTRNKYIQDMVNSFYILGQNYKLFGDKQIFTEGTPTINNYNEQKFKNYLNNIKYEKSFFGVNVNLNISNISTFLELKEIKTLKYFEADYLLGKIPNDFKNKLNNSNIEGLKMREINPYFSEKFEKVIPCYKQKPNICKELNEFDFENEEKYNGTCLEEKNENYVTCYQIDKSSESFLVLANLKFSLTENKLFKDYVINDVEINYISQKLIEMNEAVSFKPSDSYDTTLGFIFKCFSDNIEIVLTNFIKILKEEPKEYEFEYAKNILKYQTKEYKISLIDYATKTANSFINKGKKEDRREKNDKEKLEKLNNLTFNDFKNMHNDVINNILSLEFKLAGNIEKDLVLRLHNLIKENIKITPRNDFKLFSSQKMLLNIDSSYVIDYYEKSNLPNEVDNAIVVLYSYDQKYSQYMDLLTSCLNNIAMVYLRFEYSNTYTPSIYYNNKYLFIVEQGRYKEVTEMEDDINEVLLRMIRGDIQCENYAVIIESYKLKNNQKSEKNMDILFHNFVFGNIFGENVYYTSEEEEVKYPDNFDDFIRDLSSIFLEPKRYTILIARKDLSEEDYKKMIDNRKKNAEYKLNKNIEIQHTEEIDYLNKIELGI